VIGVILTLTTGLFPRTDFTVTEDGLPFAFVQSPIASVPQSTYRLDGFFADVVIWSFLVYAGVSLVLLFRTNTKKHATLRKHLKLFVVALGVVILVDQIIDILNAVAISRRPVHQPGPYWNWGAHDFLGGTGLSGLAAYNETLNEIWFAETMVFILVPLILIWFYRRPDFKFWTPWILTGLVAFFAVFVNFAHVYSQNWSVSPPQYTETLHDGAYSPIHKNLDKDYLLGSAFGEFLTAQLLFIIPFTIGYLATRKSAAKD
jgi:hypothetical protein